MPRSGPISMTLPPFAGATRRLILWNVAIFFALAILTFGSKTLVFLLEAHLALTPTSAFLHGEVWQFVTYAFLNGSIFNTAFAMLTLWFVGSLLEGSFGSRWLYEIYFVSAIGGALVASAVSLTGIERLQPIFAATGPYAGIFGLMIAIGAFFGDQEFLLFFVLRMKAKYLVAIYILIDVAMLLKSSDAFSALLQLSGGLCGYIFLRFAPRRGIAMGFSERYYALRNQFYRAKRRRAAKKFEVYMRKQNREVHFDKDGRYVDPDKDPTDKRWMN
jgi:membrane associated rhomboid family serine protease